MINITSPAFVQGGDIPAKYTCDGENVNPEINIANVPENAKELILIMDDPDAPNGVFTHWLVWDISPKTTIIEENTVPKDSTIGLNSAGAMEYLGPCPPSGIHRYFFKVYALSAKINLPNGLSREDVIAAMDEKIIDEGELMGKYSSV